MKKNRMMRLASVLLVLCLLTTSAISGTFAKYTSTTGEKTDTARVALWDIKLNSKSITETFSFDLFDTIKDSDGNRDEEDINPADGSIIAPGTSGSFAINLVNDSEVTAVYSAAFSVPNTSIPIEFKVGDGAWGNTLTTPVTGTLPVDNASSTEDEGAATVTVYWRWPFTDNTSTDASAARDASDTTLGLAGTASVTVTANVTVTQVD